ncbi:hypothetical protein [Trichormus azollae]|nr:hypothetical protein [Trichormus azollae]
MFVFIQYRFYYDTVRGCEVGWRFKLDKSFVSRKGAERDAKGGSFE